MKVMNSTLGPILAALLLAPRAALRAAGRPKWGRTFLLRSTLRAVLRGLPERPDWIAVIKRGLELRGHAVGPVRRPMLPLTEEVDALVKQVVAKMSFT